MRKQAAVTERFSSIQTICFDVECCEVRPAKGYPEMGKCRTDDSEYTNAKADPIKWLPKKNADRFWPNAP